MPESYPFFGIEQNNTHGIQPTVLFTNRSEHPPAQKHAKTKGRERAVTAAPCMPHSVCAASSVVGIACRRRCPVRRVCPRFAKKKKRAGNVCTSRPTTPSLPECHCSVVFVVCYRTPPPPPYSMCSALLDFCVFFGSNLFRICCTMIELGIG